MFLCNAQSETFHHILATLNPVSLGQWKDSHKRNYGWGNIYVAVLCRNWRLFHHIFIASFKVLCRWTSVLCFSLLRVSAPHSRVFFHCEVACLSLAVWTPCLAQPLSLRFLAPLFRSLSEWQHVEICFSFLGRLQSSVTSCSCASLTRALLELVWVSMGNKACSPKRWR